MIPAKPLPIGEGFASPDDYLEKLLHFVSTSDVFQILCGGVHILDFFTIQPGLFHAAIPNDWHGFVLDCDIMDFLSFLMHDDLDFLPAHFGSKPPESLINYVRSIRMLSMTRSYAPGKEKLPNLPRTVAIGMNPKKIHEVAQFADYVEQLSDHISSSKGTEVSHFVDFGSGQNYLGRTLASEPYNKHVVAVEGRENNVSAAQGLDVRSGLASKPVVKRNKKLWNQIRKIHGSNPHENPEALAKTVKELTMDDTTNDFRTVRSLGAEYTAEDGRGFVHYVSGRLDSGNLSDVITKIGKADAEEGPAEAMNLMAMSIHSCGNLSHYGIRSLILNPEIKSIAIVGCCYNLLTEKLGPPTYKHPHMRPTLQALNGRVRPEAERYDPEGFPLSSRFSTYNEDGVRLNITARMMACQAPQNWTEAESEGFFTRHFYRAVLQKIFFDRGIVTQIQHDRPSGPAGDAEAQTPPGPLQMSTSPVIIGSLRKNAYSSFKTYVYSARERLSVNKEFQERGQEMQDKLDGITDEDIERYEQIYQPRRQELSVVWSLMAFSATVVESLIVADRWTFLKEHEDVVEEAWVEPVFDYKASPRNLVVVGIKK